MTFEFDTGSFRPPAKPAVATGAGFQRFGIDHLSASSINAWTSAPDVWVARYLLGRGQDFPFGPAAERGKAVEAATVATLLGEESTAALKAALDTFDQRFPNNNEATAKERALIAPMVEQLLPELSPYGYPEFATVDRQDKIIIAAEFDNWSMPVWGFLDLVFPKHGLVVDIKTTTRIPSVMSAPHQLQRAIYSRAKGNFTVRFLYASAKKAEWRENGDPAAILATAKGQIARMDAFLRACPDAETARQIVPVNPDTFFWRGAEALRNELYGV